MMTDDYVLVGTPQRAIEAVQYFTQATNNDRPHDWASLDFETTGLNAYDEGTYVRLAQITHKDISVVIDFGVGEDNFFSEVAPYFTGGNYVAFNIKFEASFLFTAGGFPNLHDVGYLRKAINGGGHFNLKALVEWDLGKKMSKEEQSSDWASLELRQEQYDYAYLDAKLTYDLWIHWLNKTDAGQWRAFRIFNDLTPIVMEMEWAGFTLNAERHKVVAEKWVVEKARVEREIKAIVGDRIENIGSNKQWSKYLLKLLPANKLQGWARTGKTHDLSITNDMLLVHATAWATPKGDPLSKVLFLLADYKKLSTYITRYGETLIIHAEGDGRVRTNYNTAAAITGRFSCSAPAMQQLPRNDEDRGVRVRASFVAPEGRKLVALDYSGIEVRVAALISGDNNLLQDCIYGDMHLDMAEIMTGAKVDKNTPQGKADRYKAKAANFSLLYGAADTGVASAMKSSKGEGRKFIDAFSDKYPHAYNIRYSTYDEAVNSKGYIRCIDGGTIFIGKTPDLPICANYPVQRAAFSLLAKAMIRFKKRLDALRAEGRQTDTLILASIHDQLIAESSEENAEECLAILEECMIAGFLDIFPEADTTNLVEGGIGDDWGQL